MRKLNYSCFVMVSKILCILFAVLFAFLTVVISVYGSTVKQVKIDLTAKHNYEDNISKIMYKPRFYGVNAYKEAYSICAKKAEEQDINTILLTKIDGQFITKDNTIFNVYSNYGKWIQDSKMLLLSESVTLCSDGTNISSNTATIDVNKNTITSNSETRVINQRISVLSQGFTLLQKEKKVIFNGPVKTTIYPNS
ncbi:MAG: LPS export ABC transporter periplasmic protein LptC [Rickettsiales endosymbiont of Dermacentor nuttalli]